MIDLEAPGLDQRRPQAGDVNLRPRTSRKAVPQVMMPPIPNASCPHPTGEELLDALRMFLHERAAAGRAGAPDAEQVLFRLQKLVTLGQLASEVAHDFGNLTTVMLGYSQLLLATAPPNRPESEYLAELCRAAERASALTAQFLGYSRLPGDSFGPTDLGHLVANLTAMLERLLGPRVRLTVSAPTGAGMVLADARQVEQAVINLVLNARDALPVEGHVEVAVEPMRLTEPLAAVLGHAPPGEYVRLQVSDDGCGLTAEAKSQLFRPFFTTKTRGTGLGLVIVARAARQCGAAVTVHSAPGRGTTFDLHFPRLMDRSAEC
jgi:two-component system cell cycle sensor histidine kinase/response regulator CckA